MKRPPLPAELPIESIVFIQDSREQTPLSLDPFRVEVGTLATGDYSVRGMEDCIAIERKSLPDYLACCGVERERFVRELQRMLAYEVRAVVVEATWADLEAGSWRSQIAPAAVLASTVSWIARGIPVIPVGSHRAAGQFVSLMLARAARRRYAELRELTRFVVPGEVPE